MEKKHKTPRLFVYVLSLMLLTSGMVFALPQASAASTPYLSATDNNGHVYESNDPNPLRAYKNYSTGVSPYITSISGSFSYGNLQVTKPGDWLVDVYVTWYGPYGDVISFKKVNATDNWNIDVSSDHYWWISGDVTWSDTSTMTFTDLGEYQMAVVGKIYDVNYPTSTYHHIEYTGTLTITHITDQTFPPNYPVSPSLYAISNESSIWGMTGTNSFNGSEYINWAYGGVDYSYLWTTIGYDIGMEGMLTWYGPNGAVDYHTVTTLSNNYTLASVVHQSNILIGGITFSEAVDFQFDNGYGEYKLVFWGKVFDTRYPSSSGHYMAWRNSVIIDYQNGSSTSNPPGSSDPGGDPTGAGGMVIEPIVIQGIAATGGLMMVLGVMAGVWLWRRGNMIGGISCLIIMPIIGVGLMFAMLN